MSNSTGSAVVGQVTVTVTATPTAGPNSGAKQVVPAVAAVIGCAMLATIL
jgi:hypothetical protein